MSSASPASIRLTHLAATLAVLLGCDSPTEAPVPVDQPPTLLLSSPEDGDKVPDPAIVIAGQASDAEGEVEVRWRLDGGPSQPVDLDEDGGFSFEIVVAAGSHDIIAEATDSAGQEVSEQVSLTYLPPSEEDISNPKVKVLAPTDGVQLEGPLVKVIGEASDDIGVTALTLSLDAGPESDETEHLEEDGEFELEVELGPGGHTIAVFAYDLSGKRGSAWSQITIKGDD